MNSQDFVKLALQVTAMLAFAVFFGELMRRFKQPAVVGEMLGGIVLGPTIFGTLAPALFAWLFSSSSNVSIVRDGFMSGPMNHLLAKQRALPVRERAAVTE